MDADALTKMSRSRKSLEGISKRPESSVKAEVKGNTNEKVQYAPNLGIHIQSAHSPLEE